MTVDDILALPHDQFDDKANWDELDVLIGSLPDAQAQINEWNRILRHTESIRSPTGHPHFRLGILHLLIDTDETAGIAHLQVAFESDKKYATERAHRMAAYRVLSLVKDFLADLGSKKNWQRLQLEPHHRRVLISMLFEIYDLTARRHVIDMPAHTYAPFFRLIADDALRVFAGENYMCAQSLLEWVETNGGRSFILTYEYPLARAMVGLYGGVLEALLADKLSSADNKTLGQLIEDAYKQGYISIGTKLCALCTIILYFRNHVHANRTASRTAYFVDLNVAKGLKVATEVVISELIKQAAEP
ncbi:MAG: hypothetical protein ACHP8B_09180 [Terriglobales bacterium]